MDSMTIFTAWLGLFSVAFTFMPLGLVFDWKRRGTADGFSSINLVLPVVVTSCWLKHGFLTNDLTNIRINSVNICFFVFYVLAFGYYQPKRKYLLIQLSTALITLLSIQLYVESQDSAIKADTMGSIAAMSQILSLAGGIYEIKRVISMGHTEYVPATFQFLLFFLIGQWLLFGILTNNIYIAAANAAGLIVNIITIALYFVYPPLTWRVPIIGTGPQQKKTD
ncbi:unnamed protein product [Auanema sp. JU1783]|nr:unnamed protein product [Auanema sp. JU1783]